MIDLNKILLTGRLTADPVTKHLPTGTAIAEFRIASGRKDKEGKGDVVFINVAAFGKSADFCAQWLHKGSGVFIEGRLRHETWTDKDTNKPREKITVVADRVQFGESKAEAEGRGQAHADGAKPDREGKARPASAQGEPAAETSDDLPF
jgi:single-strand DNA-binding protein